jgi:surface protein
VFDNLGVTTAVTHQYSDTGTYTIRIRGQFPRIVFGATVFYNNTPTINKVLDGLKLISIDQWGYIAWEDLYYAFSENANMIYNATDVPNLSLGPRLGGMFNFCRKFNGAIANWDVSRVKSMEYLFSNCFLFNQDLSGWAVDSVINMEYMFINARRYNQNMAAWSVSQVMNMKLMFYQAYDFNQDISSWDVSRVTTMEGMFEQDSAFNQDITAWQVDSVENFSSMLKDAVSFNQDISVWDIDSAFDMRSMLAGATSFNQNLGNWKIESKFTFMNNMLDNSNISNQNYDATLIAWEARVAAPSNNFSIIGAQGLSYCLSDSVRTELMNKSSIIRGDQLNCLGVGVNEEVQQEQASFNVYPNPTSSKIFIETPASRTQLQEVFIYNMQGQLVYSKTILQSKEAIDVSQFKSGIYLLRLGNETKRVVVQ